MTTVPAAARAATGTAVAPPPLPPPSARPPRRTGHAPARPGTHADVLPRSDRRHPA
ncbi:hypothetical protein LT493_34335 [Streptomyces tricolor]|nr:hypothetical protein [Streptomyces tricolor]